MKSPRQFFVLLVTIIVIVGIISSERIGRAEESTGAIIAQAVGAGLHGDSTEYSPTATPIPSPALSSTPLSTPLLTPLPTPLPTPSSTPSPVPSPTPSPTPSPISPSPTVELDLPVIAESHPVDTEVSPTPSLTPSPPPTSTPTPSPTPHVVNGISSHDFIIMDDLTRHHVREIFSQGQSLGRDPQALSRIGDSIIETDQFLVRFGTGDYDLGPYSHLQPVVDYFSPSFERYGVGVRRGLTSWMVIDPSRSDRQLCPADESMIVCEIRLNNPSVLILVLGTNDIGAVDRFDDSMRQIVSYSIEQSVIPILSTKADRYEGRDNRNNETIRQIAAEYQVPLWDFERVSQTLPGQGLAQDHVHLTFLSEFDYKQPTSLQRGYGLFNLTAMMVLDEVWHEMKEATP